MEGDLLELQNRINILSQQMNQVMQVNNHLSNALNQNMHNTDALKIGKPEKFSGKYARSWLQSLENIFSNVNETTSEEKKIKYAVSFMTGQALEWWELININDEINIDSFNIFKKLLLEYFEPANKELNARRILSSIKQMGKLYSVTNYNREFTKWLLQVPTMSLEEQIFLYSKGLKQNIRIELERAEPNNLQEAMNIAD